MVKYDKTQVHVYTNYWQMYSSSSTARYTNKVCYMYNECSGAIPCTPNECVLGVNIHLVHKHISRDNITKWKFTALMNYFTWHSLHTMNMLTNYWAVCVVQSDQVNIEGYMDTWTTYDQKVCLESCEECTRGSIHCMYSWCKLVKTRTQTTKCSVTILACIWI